MPIRGTQSIVLVPSRVIYYEILIFVRISVVRTLRRRSKELVNCTFWLSEYLLVIRILSGHWPLLPGGPKFPGELAFPSATLRDCFMVHSYSYVVVSLASLLSHTLLQLRSCKSRLAPFINNKTSSATLELQIISFDGNHFVG